MKSRFVLETRWSKLLRDWRLPRWRCRSGTGGSVGWHHRKKLFAIPLAVIVLTTSLALAPTTSSDVPILSSLEAEPASAHTDTTCEYRYVQGITGYTDYTFWDYDRYRTVRRPTYGPVWTRVCSPVSHTHEPPPTTTTTAPSRRLVQKIVCVTVGGAAAGGTTAAGVASAPATAGTGTAAAIGGGAAATGYAAHEVCHTVWEWVASIWPW